MDFISFRPDESQSTLPGDTLLSSKYTKIDSKKANYDKNITIKRLLKFNPLNPNFNIVLKNQF